MRHFNTAGPCDPDIHYMLPPLTRLPSLLTLIDQRTYFVIHAPRQTGKTTAMLSLAKQLTAIGQYSAVMVSAEVGSPFSTDIGQTESAILSSWYRAARVRLPADLRPPQWEPSRVGGQIQLALQDWAIASPRPLVVFIDEIDALQGEALLSVLRQLRDGFPDRPQGFPQSIGLIGLRDVRDYKIASGGSDRLNSSSPFNIKVESLTIRNFNAQEVVELYQQHTDDTGQLFTADALGVAYELTLGQPWLVNALARQCVEVIETDRSIAITAEHLQQAKENLIRRRDTHLDSLAERLREPRVKAILEPMMAGQDLGETASDDRDFLVDLGLLRREDGAGGLIIANPIYQEILPRVLAQGPQDSLPSISPTWLNASGELDLEALRESFLAFWQQHGEPLLRTASYHEIAPHLVLMAFLHRVVNGGGTLEREYAIGRDRMDLLLRYGAVRLGIELKVWRDGRPDPLVPGLRQLEGYLARLGLESGWLVIFDRRTTALDIADRTVTESAVTKNGRPVTVIRA
jgi:hypothetical protein